MIFITRLPFSSGGEADGLFFKMDSTLGTQGFSTEARGVYRPFISEATAPVDDPQVAVVHEGSSLLHSFVRIEG